MKIKNKSPHLASTLKGHQGSFGERNDNLRPVLGTNCVTTKTGLLGKNKAFTLVELIVVVTILAILATIGFVSYSGYLAGTRDTNRTSQLKAMSDALEMYRTKHSLPLPDDKVDIKANGTTIAYQGYIGKNVLETIEYTSEGKDPKDGIYFSYYLTKDKKYYQLMAFLEEDNSTTTAGMLNKTYAVDYSVRYPKVYGKKLGILTDTNNTPIQEIPAIISSGYIDISNVGTLELKSYLKDKEYISGTGITFSALKTVAESGGKWYHAINNSYIRQLKDGSINGSIKCPTGFISVPGNESFNTYDFCVAQYEMSYDETGGEDVSGSDWNTRKYYESKTPVSMANRLPITEITQGQAIAQCQKIGAHLITNNEWITIARNIEANPQNWLSGTVGNGYIPNGVSDETSNGHGCAGKQDGSKWAGVTGSDCGGTNKNRLKLLNGNYIYDLAGNVREHVNKANTIDGSNYNAGQTSISGSSDGDNWDNDGIYNAGDMAKYGSKYELGKANGIGNLYYADGKENNIFLRGGNARSASGAGVFALRLPWTSTHQDLDVDFRCTK